MRRDTRWSVWEWTPMFFVLDSNEANLKLARSSNEGPILCTHSLKKTTNYYTGPYTLVREVRGISNLFPSLRSQNPAKKGPMVLKWFQRDIRSTWKKTHLDAQKNRLNVQPENSGKPTLLVNDHIAMAGKSPFSNRKYIDSFRVHLKNC